MGEKRFSTEVGIGFGIIGSIAGEVMPVGAAKHAVPCGGRSSGSFRKGSAREV